ncbi:MAG: metal-binding protein, partial [Deltaproteobacteria bacterium]|nr:metal-binding protein [Deltaproteobacteria bacterium]
MMTHELSNCARCPFAIADRLCRNPNGKAPDFCPTRDLSQLTRESLQIYKKPEYAEFARQASIQEAAGYADKELGYARVRPAKTRIEEIA